MSGPVCSVCRHPTRRHSAFGCMAGNGTCECELTREAIGAALDEVPAPAAPEFVEPTTGCAYCRAFTVGSPQTEHLVCECEEWCGDARCSHHPDHGEARRGYLARRATTDSPAGADGGAGDAPAVPMVHLPGTSPAPVVTGHEAAEPIRGGEAGPAVEVEATTPAEPSTAVRIALGSAWLCRTDRATATEPGVCARCGGPLVRHHIYAERATDG